MQRISDNPLRDNFRINKSEVNEFI